MARIGAGQDSSGGDSGSSYYDPRRDPEYRYTPDEQEPDDDPEPDSDSGGSSSSGGGSSSSSSSSGSSGSSSSSRRTPIDRKEEQIKEGSDGDTDPMPTPSPPDTSDMDPNGGSSDSDSSGGGGGTSDRRSSPEENFERLQEESGSTDTDDQPTQPPGAEQLGDRRGITNPLAGEPAQGAETQPGRVGDAAREVEQEALAQYPGLEDQDVRIEQQRRGDEIVLSAALTESGRAAFGRWQEIDQGLPALRGSPSNEPATDPYEEIERSLEAETGANLDDEDITFSQDGDTISGQLSPEGEREVAAQNAPFQGTVFGGITSAGARAGVRFSQFREENVERAQEVTGVDNLFGGEGEFLGDVREFGLGPLRDTVDARGTPAGRSGGIESQLADRISAGIEDATATAFDSSQPTTPAERTGEASTPDLGNAVDAVQSAVDPFVGMDRATTPAERTGGAGDIPTTPAELFGAEEQDVPEVSGGTLPVFSGVGAGGAGGVGRATQAAGAATGLGLVGLGAAATTEQPEASAEVPVPDEGTYLPQQEQGVSSTTGTFADEVPVPDPTAVEDFGVPEQGIEIGPTDDPRSTTEMDPGGATAPDEFDVPTNIESPVLSTSPQQIGVGEGTGGAVERVERSQDRSVVPDEFIPSDEQLLGRDYGGSLEYNRGGNFVGRNYDPSRTLPSAEEIFFGAGETPGVQERQDAAQASEVTAGQGVGSALDPFANVAADVGAAEDVASRPATGVRAQQFTVPRVQIDAFQRPVDTGEPTATGNPVGYPAEPAQGTPTIPFDLTPPPSSSRKPPWGLPGLDGGEDVYSEQAGGARGEIFTGFRDPLTGDPL